MAEPASGQELPTPHGVSTLLFVDRKTVSRWAQAGKLAFVRTPGGHRRYLKSDILAIRAGDRERPDLAREQRAAIPSPRTEPIKAVTAAEDHQQAQAVAREATRTATRVQIRADIAAGHVALSQDMRTRSSSPPERRVTASA